MIFFIHISMYGHQMINLKKYNLKLINNETKYRGNSNNETM